AGNTTLLSAADTFFRGARILVRRLDGRARRRAQTQGKTVRALGRRAVADVPVFGDAQTLRSRRPAQRRRAVDALGYLGCNVQCAKCARRRHLQFSESADRRADATDRLSARTAV